MKSFANESYHRVIIDDYFDVDVKKAVDNHIKSKYLIKLDEVIVNQTLCLRSKTKKSGVEKGKDIMYRDNETCRYALESDYKQDSLIIGKYSF